MASISTIFVSPLNALLTAKQVATLANVAAMDAETVAVASHVGNAATRKAAAAQVAGEGFAKMCESFQKSGCTNVSQFSALVNGMTGVYADGSKLDTCTRSYAGFLHYRSHVSAWARGAFDGDKSPSVKTLAARQVLAGRIVALVDHVEAMRDTFEADKAAQALIDSGMVDAATVDPVADSVTV